MEKLKHARLRVFVTAAAILLASAAVFIVSIQLTMGAEENKVVEQPSAKLEAALAETPQPSPGLNTAPAETAAAGLSEEPHINNTVPTVSKEIAADMSTKPVESVAEQHVNNAAASASAEPITSISKDEAIATCKSIAAELFGMNIDSNSLTVTFSPSKDEIAEEDIVYTTVFNAHSSWSIESPDFYCGVDGATGTVISFWDMRSDFTGERIAEEAYGSNTTGITPDGKPADMHNSPDDIYIKAAAQTVNDRLADGRQIVNIQIGATHYIYDEGTMQVDCQVYMATGMCYTLSFWGTDEPVLKGYMSHPTQHACTWGYFYKEEGGDYPPESANGEWYTAPGIEGGGYSNKGLTSPMPSFSN